MSKVAAMPAWLPEHLHEVARETGLADLVERAREPADYFDERPAARAVRFFSKNLRNFQGEWAGHVFVLEPWQELLVWVLFGWQREDGTRKFRRVYVEIPRKNGKSTFTAGLKLKLLFADNEPGAQIYGAAYKIDQADIIYQIASMMVLNSPTLKERARVIASTKRIIVINPKTRMPTGSFYRAIPGERAKGQTGYNAHATVVDELEEQENDELISVLDTSTASRRQPVSIKLTTAGEESETETPYSKEHDFAVAVLAGKLPAPRDYLAIIYAARKDEDWRDIKVWERVNPGMRTGLVKRQYVVDQISQAINEPWKQDDILRFHLNLRRKTRQTYTDMTAWEANARPLMKLEDFKGRECYLALDLSNKVDLSALSIAFPPKGGDAEDTGLYETLAEFWTPKDTAAQRALRDYIPYDRWIQDGWMHGCDGEVIRYAEIKQRILELSKILDVREIAYDPWGAWQLAQELSDEGFTVVEMRQGFKTMSEPTKELNRLIRARRLLHAGHPVLTWMADNLKVMQDPAENVKPDRRKTQRKKIDGMVTTIMALGRAVVNTRTQSVYEKGTVKRVG